MSTRLPITCQNVLPALEAALRHRSPGRELRAKVWWLAQGEGWRNIELIFAREALKQIPIELGKLLLAQGQVSEGLAEFGEALRLNLNDAEGHFVFGQALATQGRRVEAAAQFKVTLQLNPGHTTAASNSAP